MESKKIALLFVYLFLKQWRSKSHLLKVKVKLLCHLKLFSTAAGSCNCPVNKRKYSNRGFKKESGELYTKISMDIFFSCP
jgi:hypothetical protein